MPIALRSVPLPVEAIANRTGTERCVKDIPKQFGHAPKRSCGKSIRAQELVKTAGFW